MTAGYYLLDKPERVCDHWDMDERPTINLASLATHFSDERAAYELVESIRWPDGPVCPHCGVIDEAYPIKPQKSRQGKVRPRKLWKCKACKKQFTVTVGTIFERSHIPLNKWLLGVHLMCSAKNGVSAHELHRDLGIGYQAAWFMAHRVREAMRRPPLSDKFMGIVEADETWIGPRSTSYRKRGGQAFGNRSRTPVVTLVDRESGEARSHAVANVTAGTVNQVLFQHVDTASTLMTDQSNVYTRPGHKFVGHHTVDHSQEEYVRDRWITTNTVEGFFGQLKRSLNGTYHRVSEEHLHRYLAEFDLRYSTRKLPDGERTKRVIDQAGGRRLTYRDPTR
jgi:transposase-like protein